MGKNKTYLGQNRR